MRSMTGYGGGRAPLGDGELVIELRSVNHRFLDVKLRFPGSMNDGAAVAEELVRARLARGRVEVTCSPRRQRRWRGAPRRAPGPGGAPDADARGRLVGRHHDKPGAREVILLEHPLDELGVPILAKLAHGSAKLRRDHGDPRTGPGQHRGLASGHRSATHYEATLTANISKNGQVIHRARLDLRDVGPCRQGDPWGVTIAQPRVRVPADGGRPTAAC